MADENRGSEGVLGLGPLMNAVAEWVQLCRAALEARDELAVCTPEEIARIARKIGVRPDEFEAAIAQEPGTDLLLEKMLTALGIDPKAPALQDPAVIGELRRLCARCCHKARCERDLAAGTAIENFSAYCPNAEMLDAIRVESASRRA